MPYFYVILLVCGLDQTVKFLIQAKMTPFQCIPLLDGWFSLTYVSNYGAAFGILQSQTWLLMAVAIGVFLFIWFNRVEMRKYPKLFQIGIAIALGGALGNFIDRLRQGFVTDYMDLRFWPVFNLADVAILGGVVLIIVAFLHQEKQRKNESSCQKSIAEEDHS